MCGIDVMPARQAGLFGGSAGVESLGWVQASEETNLSKLVEAPGGWRRRTAVPVHGWKGHYFYYLIPLRIQPSLFPSLLTSPLSLSIFPTMRSSLSPISLLATLAAVDTSYDASGAQFDTTALSTDSVYEMRSLILSFDTIAGGATSVTFFLAEDIDGDLPLNNSSFSSATQTIMVGRTTTTKGRVFFEMGGFPLLLPTGKSIYLFVKVNAGTVANLTAKLIIGR